jgi:hypothetical protein
MKTTLASLTVFAGLVALTASASAQVYGIPGAGYPYYNNYHHASTVEQGVLDGYAAVTSSAGQANYFNSLAAINYQDARSRSIQNNKAYVESYFYMKQANTSARKPLRLTTEQLTAIAKDAAPDRLSPQDYDSTLGRLHWPAALLTDDFAAERDALESMFRNRSPGDMGAGSTFYADVKQLSSALQAKLGNHIAELDPAQYIAAKKFLQGVTVESTQPLVVRALASR